MAGKGGSGGGREGRKIFEGEEIRPKKMEAEGSRRNKSKKNKSKKDKGSASDERKCIMFSLFIHPWCLLE
jgi:hypothetical protein